MPFGALRRYPLAFNLVVAVLLSAAGPLSPSSSSQAAEDKLGQAPVVRCDGPAHSLALNPSGQLATKKLTKGAQQVAGDPDYAFDGQRVWVAYSAFNETSPSTDPREARTNPYTKATVYPNKLNIFMGIVGDSAGNILADAEQTHWDAPLRRSSTGDAWDAGGRETPGLLIFPDGRMRVYYTGYKHSIEESFDFSAGCDAPNRFLNQDYTIGYTEWSGTAWTPPTQLDMYAEVTTDGRYPNPLCKRAKGDHYDDKCIFMAAPNLIQDPVTGYVHMYWSAVGEAGNLSILTAVSADGGNTFGPHTTVLQGMSAYTANPAWTSAPLGTRLGAQFYRPNIMRDAAGTYHFTVKYGQYEVQHDDRPCANPERKKPERVTVGTLHFTSAAPPVSVGMFNNLLWVPGDASALAPAGKPLVTDHGGDLVPITTQGDKVLDFGEQVTKDLSWFGSAFKTCTWTPPVNTTPGVILIDTGTLPAGDPHPFYYAPSWGRPLTLTDTAPPHASMPLLAGTYAVSVPPAPGWAEPSATCSDGSPISAIDLSPGETVVCAFIHAKMGSVTVRNVMVGGADTFAFSGTPNGDISVSNGTLTRAVAPDAYTSSETVPAGWAVASVTCDDSDSLGSATAAAAVFEVAPGEHVTCTFVNTKAALSIDDPSITEGDAGSKQLTFTISRSAGVSVHDVRVEYTTEDMTAQAGTDYTASSGVVVIGKDSSSATLAITVQGDLTPEANETLRVRLSNPVNAVLTKAIGMGTILNDDTAGGKNLRISSGVPGLEWASGNAQAAYALIKYDTSTGASVSVPLSGNATGYTDTAAVPGRMYCYVLVAIGAQGLVVGISDLLCGIAGAATGTVTLGGTELALNQTATASITWTAPTLGADSYLLRHIPMDGGPVTSLPLSGTATTATHPVAAAGSCFQVIAFKGAGYGAGDVFCGVAGVSSFGEGLSHGMTAREATERVRQRIGGLRTPACRTEVPTPPNGRGCR